MFALMNLFSCSHGSYCYLTLSLVAPSCWLSSLLRWSSSGVFTVTWFARVTWQVTVTSTSSKRALSPCGRSVFGLWNEKLLCFDKKGQQRTCFGVQDDANKMGGKWIIRLRKGLASRCWENLILAMLGEQFMVGEEICGAVVSVRFQVQLKEHKCKHCLCTSHN